MAWANLRSLELTDEEKYDRMKPAGIEPPDYPQGLQFSVPKDDLTKAGIESPKVGDTGRFSAMAEVMGKFENADGCRIEMTMKEFAGEDGKLFDLTNPAYICFTDAELEKLDLDSDCEPGDTIHLIGTARIESTSSTEMGGDMASLQILELSYEDESAEARS